MVFQFAGHTKDSEAWTLPLNLVAHILHDLHDASFFNATLIQLLAQLEHNDTDCLGDAFMNTDMCITAACRASGTMHSPLPGQSLLHREGQKVLTCSQMFKVCYL